MLRCVPAAACLIVAAVLAPALGADDSAGPVAGLLEQGRAGAARDVLHARLARDAGDLAAWLDLGQVERFRCNLDEAERSYWRVLVRDLFDPEARAGLAEIHLLRGDPARALAEATLALATPAGRRSGTAWRARAMALVDLGDYDRALAAARAGVRLAPDDARVVEAYARAAFRSGDMDASRQAYTRATELEPHAEEANLRLGSGFGPERPEASWRTGGERILFERALRAWDDGRLVEAAGRFRALCRSVPDVYKYRLGLGLVRRDIRRWNEVAFGGDVRATYRLLPAPGMPLLSAYVTNWDALGEPERHVIRVAAAPAARWMEALLEAGASHEVLLLPDSLSDAPSRRDLSSRRTFDGRLYGHLRGVGGAAAATGVEKLRTAAAFGFNTFAHEFAHQVLRQAFPEELVAEVTSLYQAALRDDRCLDYYAASNVDEYFAQGYEALVSLRKRGCLRDTARHTREELARRDPALYAFLLRHLDLGHETEAAMRTFWNAMPP